MARLNGTIITQELIEKVKQAKQRQPRPSNLAIANEFGIATGTVSNILHDKSRPVENRVGDCSIAPNEGTEWSQDGDVAVLTIRAFNVNTLSEALRHGGADLDQWEVDPSGLRFSQTTMRLRKHDANGIRLDDEPRTFTNWHIRFRRKSPEVRSLEILLGKIQSAAPIVPPLARPPVAKGTPRRVLEISILDPHLGLRCYRPAADHAWDIETCKSMVMDMIERLLEAARPYGPYEEILLPWGNDFLHADNIYHKTTGGTDQPEAESWHHVYQQAEELALAMIDRLKQETPVHVIVIPGNHDRQSVFTLGRLLAAYYHRDGNVTVDAGSSPYKFWHFGVNLIGLDHGHSIRNTVRLAALMANECRDVWGETVYREWHLGDQHRKGSSKPSMMEEQGVSIEYLPGLTPPNEWHRIKSFNWQKRAGLAFVWDHTAGPLCRFQVNVNSYSGQIMESGKEPHGKPRKHRKARA